MTPVPVSSDIDELLRKQTKDTARQFLINPMNMEYLRLFASTKTWVFYWSFSTPNFPFDPVERTVTGSAATLSSNGWGCNSQTNNTAGSRARIAMKNLTGGVAIGPDGAFGRTLDFSIPGIFAYRFTIVQNTANGQAWVKFGEATNADGDITDDGIQVRVDGLTVVYGVHNGTTLIETTGSTIASDAAAHSITVEWDGAGNWTFFLDGVQDGVVTHSVFSTGYGFMASAEVYNGPDSANMWMDVSPLKFGIVQ